MGDSWLESDKYCSYLIHPSKFLSYKEGILVAREPFLGGEN